jgi:hypothetical protein
MIMRCKLCQREFTPNKYHPHQQICFRPECQHLRQIQNQRDWRSKNPEYFKCRGQEGFWRENRKRYRQQWKITHKDYLKEYQESHLKQRREYMREYMRRYRAIHKKRDEFVNRNKS